MAESDLFPPDVNEYLLVAATHYRGAFECWQAYYKLLGHRASEAARKTRSRRVAGAAVIRAWLEHEKTALGEIKQVLSTLD